jgi:Kef-type K+ transport system membrane component KefB
VAAHVIRAVRFPKFDARRWLVWAVITAGLLSAAGPARADGGSHDDPIAPALLALACIMAAAKLGAECALRLGQAPVLGELLAGLLAGNLDLLGIPGLEWMATDSTVDMFARLGVILLLFEVGLESTVHEMLRVGWSSLLVALLGVVAPFALGWGASAWLIPEAGVYTHAFIGATLTATSVGITARVLKDLGRGRSDEARIILGAAVIDDVLGLVILAVVTGVIAAASAGRTISPAEVSMTLVSAAGFLVGALLLGVWLSPMFYRAAARLRAPGVLLTVSLVFCFVLSWAANAIGLAPIVGAFAAGLILEQAHYEDFVSHGEHELEELVHPITSFVVPVFFFVMGMRTDLRAFLEEGVLLLAAVLTVAAILGKQACSLGVVKGAADRLTVGLGMIPRGEVGLIFANIGLGLSVAGTPVISSSTFSAVVVMVILTTMVTPGLLKWSVTRERHAEEARGTAD